MLTKIFISFIFMLFISCTDYGSIKNEYQNSFDNKCEIIFLGKKEFPADDETSILTNCIQYVDNKKLANTFLALNKHNNTIYIYDYDSLIVKQKISYDKEGANGVGAIQGFHYLNSDSIFIFCENTQTVYLTNEKSEVIWKKILPAFSIGCAEFMPAIPNVQTNSPLQYVDQKLILQGSVGETLYQTATNAPITSIYDIKNDTVLFANNYPEQYQKYNWGGWGYKMPYYDLNKEKAEIIISFPQDHHLYIYSLLKNKYEKHYAGSRLIDKINAYDEKKEFTPRFNEDRVASWFYSNPSYRSVIYDKYRKHYYRIALLPKKEGMGNLYNQQPTILIVLDENLDYIGEYKFPNDIDINVTNCFVSKNGFNIQILTDNENFYTFYLFNIKAC